MENITSNHSARGENSTQGTHVASPADYPEFYVAVLISKIAPPCILVLGGFGNIATVFVMHRIKDHNSSQYAILMALAVSDFILLSTTVTAESIRRLFHWDLLVLHVAVCKVVTWVSHTTSSVSAWLVTCVTVQRTMAVLWPHRMRGLCTVQRTWIIIATLVFCACAYSILYLLSMEIIPKPWCDSLGCMQCFVRDQSFYLVFTWMDLCMYSIIPSATLFVCDIVLSVSLFKAVSSSSLSAHADYNAQNTDSRKKTSYKTTVMVLAISGAFLVLSMPVCVYLIWLPYVDTAHPRTMAEANLFYTVSFQMWFANSAVNFYLYCLTGTKFRKEFMIWIRCGADSTSVSRAQEIAPKAARGG